MFFFGAILAIVAIAYFLLGGITEKVVCETFKNPNTSQIIDIFDDFINIANTSIKTILNQCYNDNSIYNVLNFEENFNLSQIENIWTEYKINETLNDVKEKITDINLNIILLSEDNGKQLDKLIQSNLSNIKFDDFVNKVTISRNV